MSVNGASKYDGVSANQYDAFLSSASLIKQIPRLLGPGLNKAGKFPTPINPDDNLEAKVNELKGTIRFQMKKFASSALIFRILMLSRRVLTLGVAIGHVNLTQDEIVQNAHQSINFLISLLKKNWQNVRSITIKSTMGAPQRLY